MADPTVKWVIEAGIIVPPECPYSMMVVKLQGESALRVFFITDATKADKLPRVDHIQGEVELEGDADKLATWAVAKRTIRDVEESIRKAAHKAEA